MAFLILQRDHLAAILQFLSTADRKRLRCVCRGLRATSNEFVQHAVLDLQGLDDNVDSMEQTAAVLATFSNLRCLQLVQPYIEDGLSLRGTASKQQCSSLRRLKLINPEFGSSTTPWQLKEYPNLASLIVQGGCPSSLEPPSSVTPFIQHLCVRDNSDVTHEVLHKWLSQPIQETAQALAEQFSTALALLHSQPQLQPLQADHERACSTTGSQQQQQPQQHNCCAASSGVSSKLHQLLKLDIAAAGLHDCKPAWPLLRSLDLRNCSQLGSSWAFLYWCTGLTSLSLHSCWRVTNATLQMLGQCLRVTGDSSTACMQSICPDDRAHMQTADMQQPMTAAAAVQYNYQQESSGANVNEGNSGQRMYISSAGSKQTLLLHHLDLCYTRVSDPAMAILPEAFPCLEQLALKGCNVSDAGLLHVVRLQQLTALHIKHCHRLTEEGVQWLSALPHLQELSYGYTSMPEADDVAASISSQFRYLTSLDLLAAELTDKGLSSLGQLPQLHRFMLYQAAISEDGLRRFGGQLAGQGLTELTLYGLGGLRQLGCLGAIVALQKLQLGGLCELQLPTALQQLSAVQQLQRLTLERIDGVNDTDLQHILVRCRQLQSLRVRECDYISGIALESLALRSAREYKSSASLWAGPPSCDTDDEEDGWQVLPVC